MVADFFYLFLNPLKQTIQQTSLKHMEERFYEYTYMYTNSLMDMKINNESGLTTSVYIKASESLSPQLCTIFRHNIFNEYSLFSFLLLVLLFCSYFFLTF